MLAVMLMLELLVVLLVTDVAADTVVKLPVVVDNSTSAVDSCDVTPVHLNNVQCKSYAIKYVSISFDLKVVNFSCIRLCLRSYFFQVNSWSRVVGAHPRYITSNI